MAGRKTDIEPTYRLSIPGILIPSGVGDTWHRFVMTTDDMLELHHAIRNALGLERP